MEPVRRSVRAAGFPLARVVAGPMGLVLGTLSDRTAGEEAVAGHLLDLCVVNDQFGLGDTHRQGLTDANN